jgi:dTDP-4-amino-4,6-dideoxygalactose transaminase
MHALATAAGFQVPIETDTIAGLRALWRLPVLHESERQAEEFARDAASLGVSRLYGASQPEFTGTDSQRAREQWPVAWSFARRLTTLPTHGRLSGAQMVKLRRLLEATRGRG